MSKLYKLTDGNGQTRNGTQWGEGVTHSGTGTGELCSNGYIHAYEHPLLAVLLNPIHADFKKPRLWEAEGDVALRDGQLKCGCVSLTTIKEIPLPQITVEQRVRFAIMCAKEVCKDSAWNKWADDWLSGKDRTARAARAAAAEAARAARAAAWAAAWAAEAARAEEAAAEAARAAAWAAAAAAWAAEAAWAAAAEAARAAADLNLVAIAEKAIR